MSDKIKLSKVMQLQHDIHAEIKRGIQELPQEVFDKRQRSLIKDTVEAALDRAFGNLLQAHGVTLGWDIQGNAEFMDYPKIPVPKSTRQKPAFGFDFGTSVAGRYPRKADDAASSSRSTRAEGTGAAIGSLTEAFKNFQGVSRGPRKFYENYGPGRHNF